MAKTQKNVISFNQIEKVIKDNRIPKHTVRVGGEESFIEVEISPHISMTDYILMIDEIASNTFITVDDKKLYVPSHFNISLTAALIRYFTNIKSDTNADRIWEFNLVTGIGDKIKDVIGSLYDNIVEDAVATIEETLRVESSVHKSDELYDAIISLVNGIGSSVEKFADTDVLSNISGVISKLTNVNGRDVVDAIISDANIESVDEAKDVLVSTFEKYGASSDNMPSTISEIPVLSVVENDKDKSSSVAEE